MNWAGQPLTSHEVAVNLIAGTTTRTGLSVHAERDTATYPRGIKITDREMRELEQTHTHPTRLARRMELHAPPRRNLNPGVLFNYEPLAPQRPSWSPTLALGRPGRGGWSEEGH